MKVVVCIKEVFCSDDVIINRQTKNVDRTHAEMVINPYDLHAVALALNLKKMYHAETYVITMGLPSAEQSLRECLALGIDRALLITDPALAGSDTIVTSLVLAKTIQKYIPDYDLIICGKYAIDAETSVIGPAIAERLGIAQLTYVDEFTGLNDNQKVVVKRAAEDGEWLVAADMPAVMTVTGEVNQPGYMHLNRINLALNAEIAIIDINKLGLVKEEVGAIGSPTVVGEMHIIERQADLCKKCTGDCTELAQQIADVAKACAM